MKKKDYTPPKVSVVRIKSRPLLLEGSITGGFGFTFPTEEKRKDC
ncbi:hypothetical protein [Fibrobacter sp. UWEL]|nr:hypothetical protein [Fibrobacter sp. UWEL]